ncbi:MAG: GNAT family N-acetyltransferase [Gammaproteobacteria bacterium]|nr:GNAT family N-acetyltransferase [Gammaproteobacteria bacterium]
MNLSLRRITRANYEAVSDLEVRQEQRDYVASNLWSLVEASFNEGYTTRAIYLDDIPVGFLMWVHATESQISIWRLMVDQKFQAQGIGRIALNLALTEIKQIPDVKEIEICYNPKNAVAKDFYSSFGFVETGMDVDGDDMLAVITL